MEILLWLVPSLVVTVLAMTWVTWLGREGRGEVDRDVAIERLAKALAKPPVHGASTARRARQRSTGIAVRPTQREQELTRHAS